MEKVNGNIRENPLYEMPLPTRKQNVWDTAIWLYRCRHFIQRDDYLTQEQYEEALVAFCEEWKNHYRNNPKVYSQVDTNGKRKGPNKTFEKALMAQGCLERFRFELKYHGGKSDFTENILAYNRKNDLLFETASDAIKASVDQYIREVDQVFEAAKYDVVTYKELLHQLILSVSQMHITELRIKKTALRKYEIYDLALDNYEDIAAFYNSLPTEERKEFDTKLLCQKCARISNDKLLENFKIPKSTYFEYFKPKFKEKLFPKYMFVNIAFLLSLSRTRMEQVLNMGGYSLQENARDFDQIIHNAFSMGWSQAQTNAVINHNNKRLLQKDKNTILSPTL